MKPVLLLGAVRWFSSHLGKIILQNLVPETPGGPALFFAIEDTAWHLNIVAMIVQRTSM
ncbi:MAG: hypothetical protein ACKVU0_07445 [Saprospiraceae bacterium]